MRVLTTAPWHTDAVGGRPPHLDEVAIKTGGVKHWLWRAVDQGGMVLDVLVQRRRDKRAARRFFRQALGEPAPAPAPAAPAAPAAAKPVAAVPRPPPAAEAVLGRIRPLPEEKPERILRPGSFVDIKV